jgi:hypothetical protein
MRCFRSLLALLLVLTTPAAVGAETTIYFFGHALEVGPAPVLLVGGLALIAVGAWIRRLMKGRAPEPELSDGLPLDPPLPSGVIVNPRSPDDAEHAVTASTDPSN